MEKLEEIEIVKCAGWLENVYEVAKNTPVSTTPIVKLPAMSVAPKIAVAVKCVGEPRLKTKDNRNYAWMDMELIEPALVSEKVGDEYQERTAPKGTKVAMDMKRHASLWRQFEKFLPADGKELVIVNLGKRTFKTDKAPSGKATGYDYRVVTLAEMKAKLKGK
jgi:hypothetical protein